MSFRRFFISTPVLFVAVWSLHFGRLRGRGQEARARGATHLRRRRRRATAGGGAGGDTSSLGVGGFGDSGNGRRPRRGLRVDERRGEALAARYARSSSTLRAACWAGNGARSTSHTSFFKRRRIHRHERRPHLLPARGGRTERLQRVDAITAGCLDRRAPREQRVAHRVDTGHLAERRHADARRLEGAMFNATAYQDANPTHKVILDLATRRRSVRLLRQHGHRHGAAGGKGAQLQRRADVRHRGQGRDAIQRGPDRRRRGDDQAYDRRRTSPHSSVKNGPDSRVGAPVRAPHPAPPAGASLDTAWWRCGSLREQGPTSKSQGGRRGGLPRGAGMVL